MEGRPTAAESKHQYQPNPWPRAPSGSTHRANSSTPDSASGYFTPHLDLLPILFPQQTFQDKLLQYNKLVSAGRGGGGLQTPPLPVSSTHAATRSRSSSKVSAKDTLHAKSGAQNGHGNRAAKAADTADRAPTASGKAPTAKMQGKKQSEAPVSHNLPLRPPPASTQSASLPTTQSSSVPSTPHQHARKFSFESREPSPGATQNHSPRSAYSETNGNVPSLRPLPPRQPGCPYETAGPFQRRRMPYTIGTDRLEKMDSEKIKSSLSEEDERRLTTDIGELYDRLIPTEKVEVNRKKLVQKLEGLFNKEWPDRNIRVQLFGSSGNLLCSDDSDVDICITTPWVDLRVCMIAELLGRRGMQKVVCVPAKVPIVKIWDPELKLACDMNVNNTLALENTRMVRTYVEIDERVRPLAMIIKYWTRRRIVNDAAYGGTLSSYTWICLIIAFLQLRDPPVVPALHQRHKEKLPTANGTKSLFGDDLDRLRGFGAKNKESLATLLFQFFRFYAHEFDYDKYALSIRSGKLLTKVEKKWHIASNNMLCVEEPFNTTRNLGNTADDYSFRGLHVELRRAFDLIAEGKLEECCEQYVFPKEEERVWQKPASAPRPVLVRSSSQQYAGRGGRGGGYRGRQYRNGSSSRRASSGVTAYETNTPPIAHPGMFAAPLLPPGYMWYPNAQLQQEFFANALGPHGADMGRLLYTQQLNQHAALAQAQQRMQSGSTQPTDRSRTNSFDQPPPLTAPLPPDYLYRMPLPLSSVSEPYAPSAYGTFPPSPATATTEFRRSLHRGTVHGEPGSSGGSGTLRSQSQPASRTQMGPTQPLSAYASPMQPGLPVMQPRHMNGLPIPSFVPDEIVDSEFDDGPLKAITDSPPEDDGPRFIGYYVNESTSPIRRVNGFPSAAPSAVPNFGDISQAGQARRRLSTDQLPQTILDRRMKRTSRSPSPLGHARAFSVGTSSAPLTSTPFQVNGKLTPTRAPCIVNGSIPKPSSTPGAIRPTPVTETIQVEDSGFDHPNPLGINQGYGFSGPWVEHPTIHPTGGIETTPSAFPERPVIANGSTNRSPPGAQTVTETSISHRVAVAPVLPSGMTYMPPAGEMSGVPGFTSPPSGRSRVISRQQQNGIAPLDLAIGDLTVAQDVQQHLSPVYEHRTPSPTAVRRFDAPPLVQPPLILQGKEPHGDAPKFSQKTPPTGPATRYENAGRSPADTRVNGVIRETGHVRGAKSQNENSSGWQKQKARKKGAADLKNGTNGFTHGEQLPKNDADRKGG